MIKKYTKMLLSGLVACTFAIMSVSAKDVDKAGLIAEAKAKDSNLSSIYLIGTHAFTSHYTITLQNIMDASRTIDDDLPFEQLTIYFITPEGEVTAAIGSKVLDEENITITHINTIKVDDPMDPIRAAALETLENDYENIKDNYSGDDATKLETAYQDAVAAITAARTEEDITAAREAYDAVVTELEAEEAKSNASTELSNFVENSALKNTAPGSDMDYAKAISEEIAAAYGIIYGPNINTKEEVAEALIEAKNHIVNAIKEEVLFYLETAYNDGNPYYGLVLTKAKYDEYKSQINAVDDNPVDDIAEIIRIYEAALNDRISADELNAVLEEAKSNASTELTNFVENSVLKNTVPGSDMDYAKAISSEIGLGYSMIYAATTEETIEKALNDAKENIKEALRSQVEFYLETVYNNGLGYNGNTEGTKYVLTEEKYTEYLELIKAATTMEDIISNYEKALASRVTVDDYNLQYAIEQALADYDEYFANQAENYTIWAEKFDEEVKDARKLIENSTTIDEVIDNYAKAIKQVEDNVLTNTENDVAKTAKIENFKNNINNWIGKNLDKNVLKFEENSITYHSLIDSKLEEIYQILDGMVTADEISEYWSTGTPKLEVLTTLIEGLTEKANILKNDKVNVLTQESYSSFVEKVSSIVPETGRGLKAEVLTKAISEYESMCNSIKTLAEYIETAKEEYGAYKELLDNTITFFDTKKYSDDEGIKQALTSYEEKLNDTESITDIDTLNEIVNTSTETLVEATRTYVASLITELAKLDSTGERPYLALDDKNIVTQELAKAETKTIEDILNVYSNACSRTVRKEVLNDDNALDKKAEKFPDNTSFTEAADDKKVTLDELGDNFDKVYTKVGNILNDTYESDSITIGTKTYNNDNTSVSIGENVFLNVPIFTIKSETTDLYVLTTYLMANVPSAKADTDGNAVITVKYGNATFNVNTGMKIAKDQLTLSNVTSVSPTKGKVVTTEYNLGADGVYEVQLESTSGSAKYKLDFKLGEEEIKNTEVFRVDSNTGYMGVTKETDCTYSVYLDNYDKTYSGEELNKTYTRYYELVIPNKGIIKIRFVVKMVEIISQD